MKICVDAGHNYSDFDTGASGNGLREQDITFEIADKVRKLLTEAGVEVVMTRKTIADNVGVNANDSINERAKIANREKCDYFVSIHCNSYANKIVNGTETLVYGLGGKAEKLANKVNKSIVSALGTYDRGIKVRPDLGVLRFTNMPAILVETAFISNESDAKLLENNQNTFAEAITDGVFEFLGICKSKMATDEAVKLIKSKAGISDGTLKYLLDYQYGRDLVIKLAKAMK